MEALVINFVKEKEKEPRLCRGWEKGRCFRNSLRVVAHWVLMLLT